MDTIIHFIWIIAGFTALYYGAEFLVKGAAEISLKFGISPLVVGLTVVAFGTSAPELLVCLEANAGGKADQAFGTIIGSNICNIALILGVGALVKPIGVNRQIIRREIPILLVSSIVFIAMLWDGGIAQWEGWILFAGILLYVISSLRLADDEQDADASEDFSQEDIEKARSAGGKELALSGLWILLGLAALKYGSTWLVQHGSEVAITFGISEAIIGLVLLAFGTSLPELATSIVAAKKGQGDIITGNAVGSCIFNILAVIGITSLVKGMQATNISVFERVFDLSVMMGVLLIIAPMMKSRMKLSKVEGIVLLTIYLVYIFTRFLVDKGVISV